MRGSDIPRHNRNCAAQDTDNEVLTVARIDRHPISMRTPNWFLVAIHLEMGTFDMDPRLERAILGTLQMAIDEGRGRWERAEAEVKALKERLSALGESVS